MRALLQRVSSAQVKVDGQVVGSIGRGLLVFLGVGQEDKAEKCREMAQKICHLRIFENEEGKFHYSVMDVGGEVLVVSQFTLYADCSRGRRPSFTQAAAAETATLLYENFINELRKMGLKVESGIFGKHMDVSLVNDGPVTIFLEC